MVKDGPQSIVIGAENLYMFIGLFSPDTFDPSQYATLPIINSTTYRPKLGTFIN